jgi:hypothetical protein
MTTERQKVIDALESFASSLSALVEHKQSITLQWDQCGVLWSYLQPAVDMLKEDAKQLNEKP